MGQAIIHVSPEKLKQLLRLPDDAIILDVGHTYPHPDKESAWNVGFYVRHEDIPESAQHMQIVWGGSLVPNPHPQYQFKCWGTMPKNPRGGSS